MYMKQTELMLLTLQQFKVALEREQTLKAILEEIAAVREKILTRLQEFRKAKDV